MFMCSYTVWLQASFLPSAIIYIHTLIMQAAKKMYGEAKLMQMLAWAFADCLGITVADPEGVRLNPPPPPPPNF